MNWAKNAPQDAENVVAGRKRRRRTQYEAAAHTDRFVIPDYGKRGNWPTLGRRKRLSHSLCRRKHITGKKHANCSGQSCRHAAWNAEPMPNHNGGKPTCAQSHYESKPILLGTAD